MKKTQIDKKRISIHTGDEHIHPTILPNVKFNLFMIISLLIVILALLSGIVYFQNQHIIQISNELRNVNNEDFYEYEYTRVKFNEFEPLENIPIVSISDIYIYLLNNGFEGVELKHGFVDGKKTGECEYDVKWRKELCDTTYIKYNQREGIFISIYEGKALS